MLFKEFMLTFLILAQQVQDAANSIYLKWIVLLWGTGQLRRLMQKGAGHLAPWHQPGNHGLLQRGWKGSGRSNKPLALKKQNTGYMEMCSSISRESHDFQHCKRHVGFPKCRNCEMSLKRKVLRNPREVLHAKHGISEEPCEARWLKAQSLHGMGSQWAESQSSAGTCRSRAPWQNWPGKFALLAILRIKKALRPPALSCLCTNKGTPTTIKLQNSFH